MPQRQDERITKKPKDNQESHDGAETLLKKRENKHLEILRDLEDIIKEADQQRQRGRRGGQ